MLPDTQLLRKVYHIQTVFIRALTPGPNLAKII